MKYNFDNGGAYSKRRRWTKEELNTLNKYLDQNKTVKDIAKELKRTETSVHLKIKRLALDNATYNEKHQLQKYLANRKYLDDLKPNSVLDLYAGSKSYYINKVDSVTSNDKNKSFNTTYNLNAFDLLCKLYLDKKKYDLIDLDPYGSAIENIYLATKLATKGLIVTYGELGHIKFKRLDFVSRFYNIHTLNDFTFDNLIKHTKLIAIQNSKELTIHSAYRFNKNLGRVYYLVNDIKIDVWNKEIVNE